MHPIRIDPRYVDQMARRAGRARTVERLRGPTTALVVVDMQHYFMADGQPAACPTAREIVPNVNRLAEAVRQTGGRVAWIQTRSGPESRRSWSVLYERMTPENAERRVLGLVPGGDGYPLWPDLDVRDEDAVVVKTRYSAFLQGSSNLDGILRAGDIDTVLVAGVSTCTCCESTARDAMMLNYRTLMISDGCAAPDDDLHNAALTHFYLQFGDVVTTGEAIDLLQGEAAG